MNDTSTSTQNVFSSAQQVDTQSSNPSLKRRKIALKVAIEGGADGRPPVQEVFPDGGFTTVPDSHFERTSAAASAFVARALVNPSQPDNNATASDETRATNSEPNFQWATTALTHIEGSIWELTRAIGVIDALFASTPLLRLHRVTPKPNATGVAYRDGGALLMAKKRGMQNCADEITAHVKSLKNWLQADNAFCDSFLELRKRCHGVRRLPDGTPLVDVGDANFVAVRRPQSVLSMDSENNDVISAADDGRSSHAPVQVTYPASAFLKFSLHQIDTNQNVSFSPVVQESSLQLEDNSVKAVIRRIRLARVSAFRRITFETLATQASSLRQTADLSSSSVTIDSGPSDLLRIEQTNRAENIPPIDLDLSSCRTADEARKFQLAAILQTVAIHGTLIHRFSQEHFYSFASSNSSNSVLDRLLNVTSTRKLLTRLESVLDLAVEKFRVRLDWTRGSSRTEETRVRVYSVADDGDGSQRLLATMEPISSLNNAGHPDDNGHVRILPAFGVIIPAPDDPSIRGRAVAPHSSVSATGSSAPGLDDVPRAYTCPVGSEILSLLTLLLCVRLLDSLETIARAGIDEMLDVDRQCFTVIVSSPTNGRVLKAKVWPQGDEIGNEVPGVNVWYNGQRVDGFSNGKTGRLTMWKGLLKKLVFGGNSKNTVVPMANPSVWKI